MSAFDRLEAGLLAHIEALGDERAAAGAGADPVPAPARLRRRGLWLAGATGALAAGAVAIAAVLPSAGPAPARVLSPEQAVAAAAVDLDSDGILEWTDVQGAAVDDPDSPGTRIERWVDLRTADHSEFQSQTVTGPGGRPRSLSASLWNVGRTNWMDEGERSKTTGKRIVRKTVVDRPPAAERFRRTPVDQVRRDLQRAAAGKLPMRDAGEIDGVPVVEIVDERNTFSRRIWISKEASPRLLKGSYTMSCPPKLRCPADVSMTSESETLVWKIHPRTPQYLAKVRPAPFDPAKYTVVTTHRK